MFESGFHEKCDAVLCVTAPEDEILDRIIRRDGMTIEAAQRRLSSQIPVEVLMERSDFVIVNSAGADIAAAVAEIGGKILNL